VDNGVITNTMNIDGYDYTGYVDIMGERPGAQGNPHIQQRMIIEAKSSIDGEMNPIQAPSWSNMNCTLYAFTITQQLIDMHGSQADTLANVFNPNYDLGAHTARWLLSDGIREGMIGKYLERSPTGELISRRELTTAYHNGIRDELATAFRAQHSQKAEVVVTPETVVVTPETVVVTPETVVVTPETVVVTPETVVVTPETVVETPETVVETPETVVETPETEVALDPTVSQETPEETSTLGEKPVDEEAVKAQQKAAMNAVNEGTPKPTEGFVARFVNSIKAAFNAVVDWVARAVRAIGMVQS